MLPEGWDIQTIEDIANVSSGGTPSRDKPEYWDGDIPWVTTAEVKFCTINDTAEKITRKGLENSSAKLYPIDTILMAMYGQGKTRGQVARLGIEASTNQACAAIQLKKGYSLDFYFQFLMSQYENIRNLSNSGGQKNLSAGLVKSIRVTVPPIEEQKKISEILTTWDKAIETTEKLIQNSQQQKKALMQQLLTGKKRLPGFEGEWKRYSIEELEEKGFISLSRGNVISKIDIQNIPGDYPIYSSSVKNEGMFGRYGNFMFDEELLTWSVDGGGNFFHREKHKFSVTNVCGYLRKHTSDISYKYLALQLQYLHGRLKFDYQSKAHPSVIRKIYVISLPEIKEQNKIADVITASERVIDKYISDVERLKVEKKALMQQLLTGKKRVKV